MFGGVKLAIHIFIGTDLWRRFHVNLLFRETVCEDEIQKKHGMIRRRRCLSGSCHLNLHTSHHEHFMNSVVVMDAGKRLDFVYPVE